MAEKRKHDDTESVVKPDYRPGRKQKQKEVQKRERRPESNPKQQKRGFTVGPSNLPDGTYKRKTQKIKETLIGRAQIKKTYAKLKRQGNIQNEPESLPQPASLLAEQQEARAELALAPQLELPQDEPSTAPHPDRQDLIDQAEKRHEVVEVRAQHGLSPDEEMQRPKWTRKPKSQPFKREYDEAKQRKAEAEERRLARENAERQRLLKAEERERFRRAMAKARTGGLNGQRKLGRESKVLLEKVRRMVGEGG